MRALAFQVFVALFFFARLSHGLLSGSYKIGSLKYNNLQKSGYRRFSTLNLSPAFASTTAFSTALTTKFASKALRSLSAVASLVNPTIAGGLLSGSLHAVTGPDHLAALLPPSVGQPGWYGMKLGATWGLGHGFSAIFLGVIAFALKERIHIIPQKFTFLTKLSSLTEAAVGVSLFFIGAIGIKENLDAMKESKEGENGEDEPVGAARLRSSRALFANGVLHGFSWDGAPSLAPALAMTSWRSAITFLLAYCIGTMAAMSITAGAFGEGSMRLGKAANNPNLARNLSIGSSVVAILIGIYWILQAFLFK